MPKLTVPEKQKPGITSIGRADDSVIRKLQQAIREVASMSGAGTIPSLLTPLLSDSGVDSPEQVAEAISSLYRVRSIKEDVSTEDFADAICTAMEVVGLQRERLKKNLISLLDIEEISTTAKAWNLQIENERVFCDARIITDLRPVFGPDITKGPKGMVVMHFLKLGYHGQAEGHQDFYVSVDSDDLEMLREVIERAKTKAEVLKASIKNFTYLAR